MGEGGLEVGIYIYGLDCLSFSSVIIFALLKSKNNCGISLGNSISWKSPRSQIWVYKCLERDIQVEIEASAEGTAESAAGPI